MKKETRRSYTSPLRKARALETRERILAGLATWMQHDGHGEFTLEAIAEEAGVERRTIFRHFANREALLEAFWVWINQRVAPRTLPGSLAELIAAPRETFARFDSEEGVIRASLHAKAGRAMRMARVPARRRAFRAALREVTRGAQAADRRRLEAAAHALYSASAWEAMRDYAGITGEQAGEAASWALAVLVEEVRRRSNPTSGEEPFASES
ncbi:MAG: TetR/AcrR family transcriptional regulator [Thermoanaerobaculia bacterium]